MQYLNFSSPAVSAWNGEAEPGTEWCRRELTMQKGKGKINIWLRSAKPSKSVTTKANVLWHSP